jgi:hypothetical protein
MNVGLLASSAQVKVLWGGGTCVSVIAYTVSLGGCAAGWFSCWSAHSIRPMSCNLGSGAPVLSWGHGVMGLTALPATPTHALQA